MKYLKTYNIFLEKLVNKEDLDIVYNKYYKDIDYKIFTQIIEFDPTSLIDGKFYVGKYCKWLLNLYKSKKLKLEDLYKVSGYIELFDKQSVRNKLEVNKRNINNYNSLGELAEVLDQFKNDEEILSKSEIKDKNFVKEFKNFNLLIPRTFEDSCVLGKGTEWCTATEKTPKYFKQYHRPGRELLILISKENPKEKYQFHFRTKQFMDKFDNKINIKEFLNKNPDINSWCKENVKDYKKIFERNDITWNKNTLEGAPEKVEGDFDCNNNQLTTLEGAPEKVEGSFYCNNNKLATLEGAPEKVEGSFYCFNNQLTTLEGAPEKVEGGFYCFNNQLTTLEGAPEKVEGSFYCDNNKLATLEGAPEKVEGDFYCNNNQLTKRDIEWLKQNCKIKGKIIWK